MRIARVWCWVAILALCAGCESFRDARMHAGAERARAEALARIDQPACRAKGGQVSARGMFGLPTCVVPFADAGKACSNKIDCDGRCLAGESDLPIGTAATGQCQRDDACFD
jgi:hypothetical protein